MASFVILLTARTARIACSDRHTYRHRTTTVTLAAHARRGLTHCARRIYKNYVQFCSSNTRSFTHLKMKQLFLKLNCVRHFYFNRLPRLWNSIPPIDLDQSLPSIKHTLHTYFWDHFLNNFHSDMPCTFHCVCPCAKCSILPVSYNFNTFVTS